MQSSELLPDITKTKTATAGYPLQWVGMEDIAVPLTLDVGQDKQHIIAAKANVYVSLDDDSAKGIHMSRLHALLNDLAHKECNKDEINALLAQIVESQQGISHNAKLDLSFDLLLPKSSLLSGKTGFQTYPIAIHAECIQNTYTYTLKLEVPYSSTCPCSASLARQLYANAINDAFGDTIDKQDLLSWASNTSVATPHSQRSYAYLELSLGDNFWPVLTDLVMEIEKAIGTPVQTMVKRSDEQEFARLNATNLMFCEDAARRVKSLLEASNWALDYWFKVEHQESLHAHNAVVIDKKYP